MENSFEDLLLEYESKIKTLAYQSKIKNNALTLEIEDVIQELHIVLWKAYETFDKTLGNQFSTYFYTMANNELSNIVRDSFSSTNYLNNIKLDSLESPIYDSNDLSLLDIIEDRGLSMEKITTDKILMEYLIEKLVDKEEDYDILRFTLGYVSIGYLMDKYKKHRTGFYAKKDRMIERITNILTKRGELQL